MNELVTKIGKEPKESITSLELLEQINIFRNKEKGSLKMRHFDLLKIIDKEFQEEIQQRKISLLQKRNKS